MAAGVNPNNNKFKQNDIVDLWYQLTGDNFKKVNLATNSEVENSIPAGKADYIQMVKEKEIPLVYEKPIRVSENQNLHIVTFSNTHYYDLSNPQKGIDNKTNFTAMKKDLQDKAKKDKTVMFFTGNLIGKEWTIGVLNTASLKEADASSRKKILFWGLKKRVDALVNDIVYAAQNGADQIILMNGREEHNVKQKLNVDVLTAGLTEKFNDVLFNYIVDRVKADKTINHKRVSVSYVPGVKKVFNIERHCSDGTIKYYDMSMHTNLKTSSEKLGANYQAAVKQHAGLAKADVILVQAENAAGMPDDDNNIAFLSGQARYMQTTKGNIPAFAPKGRSQLTLLFGEKSHEVEIAWTMNFINEKSYALEKKNAQLEYKMDYLVKLCKEKADEKLEKYANREVDYKEYLEELK